MACEHRWAQYAANPNTGKRLRPFELVTLGAFGYTFRSFCMCCGIPQQDPELLRAAEGAVQRLEARKNESWPVEQLVLDLAEHTD